MAITALWLTDFRCFEAERFEPDPNGLTVLRGENGAGKTSVLEAVAWLGTQQSFRGVGRDVLVRAGRQRAVLRAEALCGERRVLLEGELPVSGPSRLWLNRQVVRRRAEVAEVLAVSVFSPQDLAMVQGGPATRRQYLDDVLAVRHPRYEALAIEVERVLRQRGALLRQALGGNGADTSSTLDVWDGRLAASGEALAEAREELVETLSPLVQQAYSRLAGAGDGAIPALRYRRSWDGSLARALAVARKEDLRRQVTTVGPHRDELEISVSGRPARSQASQGEQRTVSLSLRLASHLLGAVELGEAPVLLLDDVFSELDNRRASALVAQLPPGQVLLTTAVDPPSVVSPSRVVEVTTGHLAGTVERL